MPFSENAVYFFHFTALCLVSPFLPLFLSRYMDESELGLLFGATRLVGVVAAPAWAYLADTRCGRGPIFAIGWLCWQILTPVLLLISRRDHLALMVLLLFARSAFSAPLMPFVDAGVVAKTASFGAARLYGSLSWGLTAPVAGIVYTNYGFAPCVAAAAVFACGAAFFAIDVVPAAKKQTQYDQVHRQSVTSRVLNPFSIDDSDDEGGAPPAADSIYDVNPFEVGGLESDDDSVAPPRHDEEQKAEPNGHKVNPFEIGDDEDDDRPRVEGDMAVFLLACACVGSGFGFVMSFLFVFIVRDLGGAATLCGLALFVECAVEVPVMRAADGLLARHGSKKLVVVVLLLYAARCCGYALLTYFPGRPWLVLLVEPLHGVTFALFYTAGVVGAKARMPSDRQTMAQGLFSAAVNGGSGFGAAVGGLGVRRYGFQSTFLVFAVGFVVATILACVGLADDRPIEDDLAVAEESRWQRREEDEFEERWQRREDESDEGGVV